MMKTLFAKFTVPFDTTDTAIVKVVADICDEYGVELIEKVKSNTSTESEFLALMSKYQLESYNQEEKRNDIAGMILRMSRLATLHNALEEYGVEMFCIDNLIRIFDEHPEYGDDASRAAVLKRKALAYINTFNYGYSEKCLKETLELFKKSKGEESEEVISVYRDMVKLYYEGERYDDAAMYGEMVLKGMRKLGHTDSIVILDDIHRLERIYCEIRAFDEAIKLVLDRMNLVLNREGHSDVDLVVVYYHVSIVYKIKGDYRKQVEWLEKSIELEEKLTNKYTSSLANSLFSLGEACRLWGEESCDNEIRLKAKDILLRAVDIYDECDSVEEFTSSEIEKWASANLYLANICAALKEYDKALTYIEAAEILFKSNRNIEDLAACYNIYAMIYDDMKSYDKAIEYYDRAVDLFDEDDVNRHVIYGNMGRCYQHCCDFERMLDYMTRAYDVTFGLLDDSDYHRAKVYSNLGDAYLEVGEYKKSKDCFKEALYIYEQQGEDSTALSSQLSSMGYITLLSKEYEESIEYNRQALEIRLRIEGEKSILTANSYSYLGRCYLYLGHLSEARELMFKALDIRKSLLGDEPSEEVAGSYYSIGELLMREGKYSEAVEYLSKSITIYTAVYNDQHTYVARSLHSLGEVYKLSGDVAKSAHYLNMALAIQNKHLRENHPDLIATRELLAQC